MISNNNNNTLDRIQNEIKETLKREDELRNGHANFNNNFYGEKVIENVESTEKSTSQNSQRSNGYQKLNGFRKFTPNITTKGVMQKFFKSRGKVSNPSSKLLESHTIWTSDAAFQPAKLTVEKGKPLRNGYVPAEEKIVKELQDFQLREAELRKERFKSQPNLMASLDLESSELEYENSFRENSSLKPARSMAHLYQPEEEEQEEHNSAPCSLKPALSLAALCDISDDELDMPGTHSLILQFEKMKSKKNCV